MTPVAAVSTHADHRPHRCPWWLGWVLVNPLRQLFEDPARLVIPMVEPHSTVLEVGPGMGFFTLPIAEQLGPSGRIYCIDVQAKMLTQLERRLRRRGLTERAELRHCTATDLAIADLSDSIDLAVLIHVLHELEDPRAALRAIATSLRPTGRLLLVEPRGHVKADQFQAELQLASECGLVPVKPCPVTESRRQLVAVLARKFC